MLEDTTLSWDISMPREPLKFTQQIEYLSVLDENGKLDKKLEPKLSDDELKTMYRYMLLARRADERFVKLQRQGRIGTFPQCTGHEAISMGSIMSINKDDWSVWGFRELAGMLYRGWKIETILLLWAGFEQGTIPPEGVNDLPICVPVATQLLHASGLGMGINYKNDKKVVLCYFGDGGTSEGDWHEGINFAAVYNAPCVFICENNQFAISVPLEKQMKSETVAQKATAYGIPGIRVDGNDVLAMYAATKEAVERARNGGGPTLIEALTYRITPHTTADDPKKYRSEEECAVWAKREPMIRFKQYLEAKGLINDKVIAKWEEEIDEIIKAGVQASEELAKSEELMDPMQMFDYMYAEMPPYLQKQKDELAKHLGKSSQNPRPAASGVGHTSAQRRGG
jgi:pyruvate dehydrogenase E1 component alpha subunit